MLSVMWLVLSFFFQPTAQAQQAGWPDLSSLIGTSARPKDAALIVSIEDYLELETIKGARKNGRDWFLWFTTGQKLPTARVSWIVNEKATKEKILSEAKRLNKKLPRGGHLWLVFIGHGAASQDGQEGLLLGFDAAKTLNGMYARSLSQQQLFSVLGKKNAKVFAVIDASFSGKDSMGKPMAVGLNPLAVEPKVNIGKVTALHACAKDEQVHSLPGQDRPAFSYLVLGGLYGWADGASGAEDGKVSAQEVVDFTKKAMTVSLLKQTPQGSGSGLNDILGKAEAAAPDISSFVSKAAKNKVKAQKALSGLGNMFKKQRSNMSKIANKKGGPFSGIRSRFSLGQGKYTYDHQSDDPGKETPNGVKFTTSNISMNFNSEAWFLQDRVGADVEWAAMPYSVEVMKDTVEKYVMAIDLGGKYRHPLNGWLFAEGGLGYQMSKGIGFRYINNFGALSADETDISGITMSAGVVSRFGIAHLRAELVETFGWGPVNTGFHLMSDLDVFPLGFQDAQLLIHIKTGLNYRHFGFETLKEEAKIRDLQIFFNLGTGAVF